MRRLLLSYFKFWFRSKNQHGIHSPFVYELATKCFYDKTQYAPYAQIKSYRNELLKNKQSIEVTDLGSGSHMMKKNIRKISHIAKNAGTTNYRAMLLYRLVNYFKITSILELGTSLGIATYAMSIGNKDAAITTIEGCPNISKFTEDNFHKYHISNVRVINGDFSDSLKSLQSNRYDLVYVDGNHQKEATINYFETLLSTAHKNSIFIFDDIYWSKGMQDAWQIISSHPKVTVSIDTFFWGLVFFRTEQAKQHFTIRL